MNSETVLYKKPFVFAGILMFFGVGAIIGGIVLNNLTKDMGYFAFIAFGIFFLIISTVTFAVYGAMQMKFKSVINHQKILDFYLKEDQFIQTAEKTSDEIKQTNKSMLMIMLAFCIIFGLLGLFILEDGYIFLLILCCLGIFLTFAAFVITKYRTAKLHRGSKRVILAKRAAFVAGEFHNWDMPGTALTGVRYVQHGEEANEVGYLEIKYSAITVPGPSEYTVVVPLPFEMEAQAQQIILLLMQQ